MTSLNPNSKGIVTGIGGFFFRSCNPASLADWYETMLGVQLAPNSYDQPPWRTGAGTTVFKPFDEDTGYFGSETATWMINFRVDDIGVIVERLRAAGHSVEYEGRGEPFPNGRFAKLLDPEGNAIQLWEPGGVDPG